MNINLEDVAYMVHKNAVEKGFWEPLSRMEKEDHIVFYLKQIAMIHSEVSETLEAIRKEKGEHEVVEEMADIIIRLLDLWCGMKRNGAIKNTTLTRVLMEKINKNSDRPKMHGVLA
jgi:NTP pyrophosphatase (non-canonical NTP hydrolase)